MDFKKLIEKFRFRRNSSKTSDQLKEKLSREDSQTDSLSEEEAKPDGKLEIDWEQIIGFGNFSVVYVGFLSNVVNPVAIKIPRVCEDSKNNYIHKNVLKEVAIMEAIGKHENVIDILGVHSICDFIECASPTFGIITPLCVNGSLQKYLRSKPIDITVIGEDSDLKSNEEFGQPSCMSVMSFCELLKFSYEIAHGMSYISSKNVIHGDLAARNVLLDENKTCKISDFGLSKRIRKVERQMSSDIDQPSAENERRTMAWRWMAIECLEGSNVSTKSDVWAYGVTLWEIFTIGDAPFPRYSWDSEFVENLKTGQLRLQKPKYAGGEIYETMLDCWNQNYKSRPNFAALADLFHKLLETATEKIQPLKCQEPETEQPLLRIRHRKQSFADGPTLELEQCKHRISFRHGGMSNIHLMLLDENRDNKVFPNKYDLRDTKFTYEQPLVGRSGTMYKEEINGRPVAVRRYQLTSDRALNELKVMAIVGDHPHVVKFIGMFLDETLMTGVKHMNIVSEYCDNKTIAEYFRNNAPHDYKDITLYTKDPDNIFPMLCKFASEIARGMEFISSKQIVQADLSSQMVLLDRALTCKIRLSSISRKVYEDEIYVKTTPEPLNWRILAVETLKRLEFSTKSDVWSFAVTAWEIFSLGSKSYADISWSGDFPELLASGFRLPSPKLGNNEIYSMLLKCWNNDPKLRPSFTQLAMFFEGIVSQDYYMEV